MLIILSFSNVTHKFYYIWKYAMTLKAENSQLWERQFFGLCNKPENSYLSQPSQKKKIFLYYVWKLRILSFQKDDFLYCISKLRILSFLKQYFVYFFFIFQSKHKNHLSNILYRSFQSWEFSALNNINNLVWNLLVYYTSTTIQQQKSCKWYLIRNSFQKWCFHLRLLLKFEYNTFRFSKIRKQLL